MKKHPFMILITIVLLSLSIEIFAQEKASQGAKGETGNVQENEHINAFRVDNIIGSKVINLEGQGIGAIDNLVIDIDTGSIVYAALEFGGFMGFGDKLFAVPWQSLTAVPAEGMFILDQSKAKLQKAPGFDKDNWPDIGDRSWQAGIFAFYRHHAVPLRPPAAPSAPEKQVRHPGYQPGYPGYRGGGYPGVWQDLYGEIFNPKTIVTVTGEILKIQDYGEIMLILYTDTKKPVLVALGPTGYFEGQRKVLKPGNKVTVTGSKVIADDTPYLIATKIKEGNEEMQVRDKEGHPVWMGWKKIK
jgi:sporulation protein YlmC with PRC-barrel domain